MDETSNGGFPDSTLIGICVILGLIACFPIIYYGAYVWESPNDIRFNEAWMGVGFGFIYGFPFWLTVGVYSWIKRAELSPLGKIVTCSPLIIGAVLFSALMVRKGYW